MATDSAEQVDVPIMKKNTCSAGQIIARIYKSREMCNPTTVFRREQAAFFLHLEGCEECAALYEACFMRLVDRLDEETTIALGYSCQAATDEFDSDPDDDTPVVDGVLTQGRYVCQSAQVGEAPPEKPGQLVRPNPWYYGLARIVALATGLTRRSTM